MVNQSYSPWLDTIEKATLHSESVSANTDIVASDIEPSNPPCLFRIVAMLETAGVFSVMLKRSGTSVKLKLNEGDNLTADCAYMFLLILHKDDTVNFQTSAAGKVTLRVSEFPGITSQSGLGGTTGTGGGPAGPL